MIGSKYVKHPDRETLPITDIATLVMAVGGRDKLSEVTGIRPGTIAAWTKRGFIPKPQWEFVIDGCRVLGRPEVTTAFLETVDVAARGVVVRRDDTIPPRASKEEVEKAERRLANMAAHAAKGRAIRAQRRADRQAAKVIREEA